MRAPSIRRMAVSSGHAHFCAGDGCSGGVRERAWLRGLGVERACEVDGPAVRSPPTLRSKTIAVTAAIAATASARSH
jgi:hypothetical protein